MSEPPESLPILLSNGEPQVDELFPDLPPEDPFDVKKFELAADLAALMVYANETRASMANHLSVNKSRITSILSGRQNLTIKVIWDFCSALDYDFDIVFRRFEMHHRPQPWHGSSALSESSAFHDAEHPQVSSHKSVIPTFTLQDGEQVQKDIATGDIAPAYIRIDIPSHTWQAFKSLPLADALQAPSFLSELTIPIQPSASINRS